MKISSAFKGIRMASKAQKDLLALRYRLRSEILFEEAIQGKRKCMYARPDDLRHAMREAAIQHFQLERKDLPEGAVHGLMQYSKRCSLDENGKIKVDDPVEDF